MKTKTLKRTILSQAIQIHELREEKEKFQERTLKCSNWLQEQKDELSKLKTNTAKKEFETAEKIKRLLQQVKETEKASRFFRTESEGYQEVNEKLMQEIRSLTFENTELKNKITNQNQKPC